MPDPYGQPATDPEEQRPRSWDDPTSAPPHYPGAAPGYPGTGDPHYAGPGYPPQARPAPGSPTPGNPGYPTGSTTSYPTQGFAPQPGATPAAWAPHSSATPPHSSATPPHSSATPPYNAGPQPYGSAPAPYPWTPPPPRRRRGLMIAVIAAVVALALCGGLATALYIIGSGARDRTTHADRSTSASQSPAKVSFAAPDQVGKMHKSANQAQADTLRDRLRTSGVEDPFAVTYDDPATKRLAIMWGGTGTVFGLGGSDKQLDGFFSAAGKDLNGGTIGAPVTVDPGPTGGNAECAKVDGLGVVMSVCAWAGTNALLGFILSGLTPEQGGEQLRAMLPAIVVKS